ncbi:hypothetical protein NC661_16735 [Aquibacillus koreensis]|uniref:Uncharacterized protein n=1 Tax=Aquibacillus koreensis TaxID=279446 RepID=A0A9X4AJN9_9BACI|nr:hypothetical protein [Aquibacillus koreensis]MCT2536217.1 hypothetical protein [Aquibacillus koreensis]MDC3422019.1 hypothetical protein [Aquibacillus koreensis]
MKKRFLVIFLFLLAIGLLTACSSSNETEDNLIDPTTDTESTADWASLDIEDIIDSSSTIALVKVKDVEKSIDDEGFESQLATLKVEKTLTDNVPQDIKLHQALNYVENGGRYILFIEQRGENGYYYELSEESVIPIKNNKAVSGISGFTGEFTIDEFFSELAKKVD